MRVLKEDVKKQSGLDWGLEVSCSTSLYLHFNDIVSFQLWKSLCPLDQGMLGALEGKHAPVFRLKRKAEQDTQLSYQEGP